MSFCALPEDADIVRGFVKVGGGSGLLSMMVPEAQHLTLITTSLYVPIISKDT